MLTMPEWFLWMDIEKDQIEKRLGTDLKQYKDHYYIGLVLALGSSIFDVGTYYIIRLIGDGIPKSLFPFISGIYTTTILIIYTQITDPFDFRFFFRPPVEDPLQALANEEYK